MKFITLTLRLAETEHIDLVSFFWSSHFFGYLDYVPELEQLPYVVLSRRLNRVVYTNMLEGRLSDVGKFIRQEIAAGKMNLDLK
ncbi:MAG: hypothetical protein JXA41_14065 [Deltaproteobacteria bacterium]|nr:hypothetical protein [Deltaproteobacteria bacterium]